MSQTNTTATDRIAFADLPGFPRLVRDYVYDFERLREFYAVDYRNEGDRIAQVARTAAAHKVHADVGEILAAQNERWGMPASTIENARSLGDSDTVAVVTGQQVGLFGGALYTLYKTLTTIRLADDLSKQTNRKVVPVFWVEGEDHDFEEIASTAILDRNELKRITYAPDLANFNGPVGRLALGEDIVEVLDEVDAALTPSDYHDDLMAALREAYKPGRSLEDAFVLWMKHLIGDRGLVYMNPDDPALKKITAPLFERELTSPETTSAFVNDAGSKLEADYHAQVHARPTNLFWMEETARAPIDVDGDEFTLRGRRERWSREEILRRLEEQPECFSPNVVMRPLMQDYLLPTVFYVAGPGEISYFAQFRRVYEWMGIEMPGIYPRASATLLERSVARVLERYALDLGDFGPGVDRVFGDVVKRTSEHDIDRAFGDVTSQINQAVDGLTPLIESIDQNLIRTAKATGASLQKELDKLKGRIFRAEKRNHDEIRSRLERASENIFPAGKLQERALSPIYFLNKYGIGLVDRLMDELDLDTSHHRIVRL